MHKTKIGDQLTLLKSEIIEIIGKYPPNVAMTVLFGLATTGLMCNGRSDKEILECISSLLPHMRESYLDALNNLPDTPTKEV